MDDNYNLIHILSYKYVNICCSYKALKSRHFSRNNNVSNKPALCRRDILMIYENLI